MSRSRGALVALGALGALGASAAAFALKRRRDRAGARTAVVSQRAARTAELVRLSSKAGAGYAAVAARSAFASEDRKAEVRADYEMRTAAQVVESLGHMKGAVMKIGQMASYLDQGLPEPVREALAQLQADAPPMAPELVAEVIRSELGSDPTVAFAEWSPVPIASASIGQVHRARTHDGRDVAVKVQYPGVDEAIRADLENSDLLFGALSMLFPGLDPKPIVAELKARISEELDYRREAANQKTFADAFADHPTIHIPAVVEGLSTGRVLSTEFARGVPFSDLLTWSQDERDLAGETIYRFAFGGIYELGIFNGDPHPGNYLFEPGGRVTFLDFGLCKKFEPDEIKWFEQLIKAMVLHDDRREFTRLCEEIGFISGAERFDSDLLYDYFRHFYELVLTNAPMTVTPEYAAASVRRFFDLSGPYSEIIRSSNVPASMVIVQRINLGLYGVLAELRATRNWRAIAEEIWPFVDAAPSTPMGVAIEEWRRRRDHART